MAGKKRAAVSATLDPMTMHPPAEAIGLVKKHATSKFDESIDIALRLGVDPRKADQMVRGTVSLPNGSGKTIRIAVFASGEKAQEARDAGADVVGAQDLADRILNEGFMDFDAAVATPDLMGPIVSKLGKVLGPRGLMPNPKTGTVTQDVAKAVGEIKGGKLEYKVDKAGNVHMLIGKASFTEQQLLENFQSVIDEITRVKPASSKGKYIQAVSVTSTMGPGIKVDVDRKATDAPAASKPSPAKAEAPAPVAKAEAAVAPEAEVAPGPEAEASEPTDPAE